MKYQKGDILAGTVTGITDYGIFVQFDDTESGLIHISEISPYYVREIKNFVKIGEIIRVKIIDVLNTKYCLSIKDLDYRILKHRRSKIKETKSGFSTLALSLNRWLQEDYQKIEKNISHKNEKM